MEKPHIFLLSGEHPSLPLAELNALLEMGSKSFSFLEKGRICRVSVLWDADPSSVLARASMVKLCLLELIPPKRDPRNLLDAFPSIDWSFLEGKTFAIRVKGVGRKGPISLSGKLGEIILKNVKAEVDLSHPDFEVFVLVGEKLYTGLKLASYNPRQFYERRIGKRPFKHPSALKPKISRCMVNLARAKPGDVFFDPFCGAGSLLIEAGLLGCRVIGSDLNAKLLRGARENLRFYDLEDFCLVVADSAFLPFSSLGPLATDLPYGRRSASIAHPPDEIARLFVRQLADLLPEGDYACIMSSIEQKVPQLCREAGLSVLEVHVETLHTGLSRHVTVVRA